MLLGLKKFWQWSHTHNTRSSLLHLVCVSLKGSFLFSYRCTLTSSKQQKTAVDFLALYVRVLTTQSDTDLFNSNSKILEKLGPTWVRLTGAETVYHLDPFSEMPNQLLPISSIIVPVSVAVVLKNWEGPFSTEGVLAWLFYRFPLLYGYLWIHCKEVDSASFPYACKDYLWSLRMSH